MDSPVMQPHGGDLGRMSDLFPAAPRPWIDLSTGINPWPYPLPPLDPALWTRLPSAADERALIQAAMASYGVTDPDAVLSAPGSQVLISCIPFLRPPGAEMVIVGPTYGEHAPAWARAGHRVQMAAELPDPAGPLPDVLLLVNPNNPDGRTHDPTQLLALTDALAARGGWLMVDEAFCDLRPDLSMASRVGRPGLLVLRSFGKFYGLAGLRLGFLLAPPGIARAMASRLGPWAVAGPALAIGAAALGDREWQERTRARLAQAMARMHQTFRSAGFEVLGGTSLYTLIREPQGRDLYRALGNAGLLPRSFADRPGLLRLGLPPDDDAAGRLAAVLDGQRGSE